MNEQELIRWLQEQVDGLEKLLAEDGQYISKNYFRGKMMAYYDVLTVLKGEDGE